MQTPSEWRLSFLRSVVEFLLVIFSSTLGGLFVQYIMRGFQLESGSVGPFRMRALCTSIQIPPLVGMIVAGCLTRNMFHYLFEDFMQHYPDKVASWFTTIGLSIMLLRVGMEIDFKGKGMMILLLSFVPQLCEAAAVAFVARFFVEMPWALCFAQGFGLAAVSAEVTMPSLMQLHRADYGVRSGVPMTLVSTITFDNIIAITAFGICLSVGLSSATREPVDPLLAEEPPVIDETNSPRFLTESSESEPLPIWKQIVFSVLQLIIGLVIGFGCGACMACFNPCWKKDRFIPYGQLDYGNWLKTITCILTAIFILIACNLSGIPNV